MALPKIQGVEDVAANLSPMTLHQPEVEVGVRELHDRLSEYLEKIEQGAQVLVTRRGRPIARMSQVDAPRPFEDLERRGLVRWPEKPREARKALTGSKGSVSELIRDQRR
jgi:antitoxin (DNA-binding transcriptional repressor) of toxin-antitoxin stability system